VTVVIPTAARPETLETTLRSVARQTARDEIDRVVVSENLGDLRSRQVCAAFSELPIEYVVQDPQLTPQAHVARLLQIEDTTEYVALVCDDDIWSPGHVDSAMRSLDARPGAACHFSAYVAMGSELAASGILWAPSLLWLAAKRPPLMSEYVFDYQTVLALSWVLTPFSFSTLVARTGAARSAAPVMAAAHQYYSDRMLCVGLARSGETIFDPAFDTMYRSHPGNWIKEQDPSRLRALEAECEALVAEEASRASADMPAMWRGFLTDLPSESADEVRRWMVSRFTPEDLQQYGLERMLPPGRPLLRRVASRVRHTLDALLGLSA
jgi:hypothetical protein